MDEDTFLVLSGVFYAFALCVGAGLVVLVVVVAARDLWRWFRRK